MPLVCMLVLLIRTRDTFGAALALWWTGESILDLAPYIDDAWNMTLQLIGGNTGRSAPYGFHDWNFVLSELNIIHKHRELAETAQFIGKAVMVLSLIWAAAVLIRMYRHRKGAAP